jgi:hypothetical protein
MSKYSFRSRSLLKLSGAVVPQKRALDVVETQRVVVREKLSSEDLIALMRGQLVAIRIGNYYDPTKCEELAEKLIGSPLYGKYVNAPIGRVGQAYFECQADEESRKRYEESGVSWIRELRERAAPCLSPFDKFRLELDEAWAAGAYINSLNKRKMFGGLVRHFIENSQAEPHQDVLAWDAPESASITGIAGQLAWNTYLKVPSKGGELVIWDISFSRKEYEERKIPNSYGLRRERLPEPVAVLQPEVGEMILFNAGFAHAVEEIQEGSRVTWSCFAGYRGPHDPFLIWS